VFPVVGSDQIWSEDIIDTFPRIVSGGITLPFDKVLKGFSSPNMLVAEHRFNLEVFLSFDKVRRGSIEVGTVCFRLLIRT